MIDVFIPLQPFLESVEKELKAATEAETAEIFETIADYAPDAMRQMMDTATRTGNPGERASGESFTRSAEGEVPAKDSFELYESILAEASGNSVILTFAYHAFYLDRLFDGEGDGGGYLNRSFIEPGIDNAVSQLESI